MPENNQIAIVSVPLNQWNELMSIVKETRTQVNELTGRDQKELLTPKDVCSMLKIGRTTFERYMNDGVIEVVQVGKRKYSKKYIKRSHLEELIKNGAV